MNNSKFTNPLVSIIVPCYNQSQFLVECLESIRKQNYKNWECLIVDDGSTDDTAKIGENYTKIDTRFRLLRQRNKGTSSAKNLGIQNSKGEWIQILDSDDILEENKIFNQIAISSEFPVDVLISGYRYFYHEEGYNNLRIIGRRNLVPEVCLQHDAQIDILELFENRNPFVISAPLYNSSIFKLVGLFDENFEALEDWDLHLRCAQNGVSFHHIGYGKLDKTLIRIHDSSCMGSTNKLDLGYTKFINKHGLTTEARSKNKISRIKRLFYLLTPPIVIKAFNKIQKNVS